MRSSLRGVALVLAIGACSKSHDDAPAEPPTPTPAPTPSPTTATLAKPVTAPQPQWYRGVFFADGIADIPVYYQLPARGTSGTGKMVNGRNEAEFAARWTDQTVTMDFSIFHADITATADRDGVLTGHWNVDSKTFGKASINFRATPVAEPAPAQRFTEKELPGAPLDLPGITTWRLKFPDSGVAKLELEQRSPGVFEGTLIFPTGNVVYLAGNARGHELRMSSLIGLSIYLLRGELDADARAFKGTWVAGPALGWHESFAATRGDDFAMKASARTTSRDPHLAMPQLAAYKGKPLIIEIGGSWCDTCKHAAAALHDIYDKYHSRGLEVVSLTYEFTDDPAYNKQQSEQFKRDYHLPWEVISMDGTVETVSAVMPHAIDGVDASGFPITLFVDRDDRIRFVHASFAGPESPEHRRYVEEFESNARAILDDKTAQK